MKKFAAALALVALLAACNAPPPTYVPPDDTFSFEPDPASPSSQFPQTDSPGGSEAPFPESEAPAPDVSLSPEDEAKIQELFDDSNSAANIADEYWANHWTEFFTGSYGSPDIFGGYFGADSPTCGGEYEDMSGNAFYCPADDYIAWDWDLFLGRFADEVIGDAFVYMVIHHEWAHAIQARLQESLVSQSSELQADCLAGATLTGAGNDGILTWEAGDRGEIFTSLVSVADEVEWGDTQDHGSADQRIEAYQQGEAGGVTSCLPTQ